MFKYPIYWQARALHMQLKLVEKRKDQVKKRDEK